MKQLEELKTFEDACKLLKLDAKKVIPDFSGFPDQDRKAMDSHAKLIIIARAANRLANNGKDFIPDWNDWNQYKYYPWFEMGGSRGFRFDDYDYWRATSNVGSRLCFVNRETAIYVGKQFEGLYKNYFVI